MSAFSRPIFLFYRITSVIIGLVLAGLAIHHWRTTPTSLFTLVVGIVLAFYWGAMFWGAPSMLTGDWEERLPSYVWSWKPSLLLVALLVPFEILFYFINFVMFFFTILFVAPPYAFAALPLALIGAFPVWFAHAIGMARITVRMRKSGTLGFLGVISEILNW